MAEGALLSIATDLTSTLGSLASKKAYERARLAKDELAKFQMTVETIRSVLPDAEKRQESSAAVKVWIRVIRDVLYDADDLFDEISTIVKAKQQTEGSKIQNQVRNLFSPSNSLAYAYRVGGQVKALRERLDRAARDMRVFCFVQSQREEKMSVVARDRWGGSFVNSWRVIGRNKEEKEIIDFLLKESSNEEKNVPVIAIVGMGGMGKSTLAQLVYNDDRVSQKFEMKLWVGMSDTYKDTEFLRKIFKAITGAKTHDLNANQLKTRIRESLGESRKYLLVLDDVWDENHTKWSERMGMLHTGCIGCRIIVTTRSFLVTGAVESVKTCMLGGLSDEHSWELFKMIAFGPEEEEDSRRANLGKRIVKQCSGVPLAITTIASHLRGRSMAELEHFMNEELSRIELNHSPIMSALKLSYDHLPSRLKHCFAYCALFPKDFVISKQKLLYLWIAQGYVEWDTDEQTVEEIGDAYFNRLLSTFFLEKVKQDEASENEKYTMHDLMHDLAQCVARDDVAVLTEHHSPHIRSARHASVGYDLFQSSGTLRVLLSMDRLRSCLFFKGTDSLGSSPFTCQQLGKLKFLRALDLSELGIEDVPRSIGGLEHLRYLNLSGNPFKILLDSVSKLLNLVTLDISRCVRLKAWPKNLRRLINLRHLDYSYCPGLTKMPNGFGELTHLQHLSDFKPDGDRSLLEAFSKLTLKEKLTIDFAECHVQDNEECWQLPVTVKALRICYYSSPYLPRWRDERPAAIVSLELHCCENLKRLPALSILRNLKTLVVNRAKVLEYVEEETTSSLSFFPCLENLSLVQLPELKGWSTTVKLEGSVFPCLKRLEIVGCPGMELWGDENEGVVEWDSLPSLLTLKVLPMPSPESLPPCLLQRNIKLCGFLPRELPLVENNQTRY